MKYCELNEMKFEDWDGKPFEAIVVDHPNITLFETDERIFRGERLSPPTIVGRDGNRWVDDTGTKWNHVYPIVTNSHRSVADENFANELGKMKNMCQKLEAMYKECSECRDNSILERNALQKKVEELESKLAEKS